MRDHLTPLLTSGVPLLDALALTRAMLCFHDTAAVPFSRQRVLYTGTFLIFVHNDGVVRDAKSRKKVSHSDHFPLRSKSTCCVLLCTLLFGSAITVRRLYPRRNIQALECSRWSRRALAFSGRSNRPHRANMFTEGAFLLLFVVELQQLVNRDNITNETKILIRVKVSTLTFEDPLTRGFFPLAAAGNS